MAQRKGELLKMEMLEKLASLHRDLKTEVEIASNARGASLSAIETAREMLGCNGRTDCSMPTRATDQRVCLSSMSLNVKVAMI